MIDKHCFVSQTFLTDKRMAYSESDHFHDAEADIDVVPIAVSFKKSNPQ